jgi:hypothetical protein
MNRLLPILFRLILLAALSVTSASAHAQGCAQCRDNAAATSPLTQRAYRHAIILLTVTAGIFFVGTLTLARRHR